MNTYTCKARRCDYDSCGPIVGFVILVMLLAGLGKKVDTVGKRINERLDGIAPLPTQVESQ